MQHIPVLAEQILEQMKETPREVKYYFDGTFGRGGHVREALRHFPELKVFAMDHDETAIAFGREAFAQEEAEGRLHFFHSNYAEFKEVIEKLEPRPYFDFMLLDLGVSSPQLDVAERGFSFYHDGPLDMRMDRRRSCTAAEVVNEFDEDDLVEIFKVLGEIPRPYRIVKAIIHDRKMKKFETTRDLASMIERIEGWSRKGHHPATRFFMALRLYVNQELELLEKAVPELIEGLNEDGRLAIITFHSLEDRIVKNIFKSRTDLGVAVNKKVIIAKWQERKKNPRARSAKLRVFQRKKNES